MIEKRDSSVSLPGVLQARQLRSRQRMEVDGLFFQTNSRKNLSRKILRLKKKKIPLEIDAFVIHYMYHAVNQFMQRKQRKQKTWCIVADMT
ncbi:MAG: hypothetical protein V2B20_16315 [Pseudomonadota bacterium]